VGVAGRRQDATAGHPGRHHLPTARGDPVRNTEADAYTEQQAVQQTHSYDVEDMDGTANCHVEAGHSTHQSRSQPDDGLTDVQPTHDQPTRPGGGHATATLWWVGRRTDRTR
jgi:hypothetical protein